MTAVLSVLCVLTGSFIVAYAMQTAIRTFLLPQPGLSLLSRSVFRAVRPFFTAVERVPFAPARRQAWSNIYAPLCLMLIVFAALVIISLGFTLILYGLGVPTLEAAFLASISSVSTLGFAPLPGSLAIPIVATLETMMGILIVALLIGYLPTIYAAVQQREQALAALAAQVGTPLSGEAILLRYARSPGIGHVDAFWTEWHDWFAALGASHNSLAGIVFVRAPEPERSWVTMAGAVLDAAALAVSTLDPPGAAGAERCLETGSEALRQVLDGARTVADDAPKSGTAPHVTQGNFETTYANLVAARLPVISDRATAWSGFARWRSQYDDPLVRLAHMTRSPLPTWSGGRRDAANSAKVTIGAPEERHRHAAKSIHDS